MALHIGVLRCIETLNQAILQELRNKQISEEFAPFIQQSLALHYICQRISKCLNVIFNFSFGKALLSPVK